MLKGRDIERRKQTKKTTKRINALTDEVQLDKLLVAITSGFPLNEIHPFDLAEKENEALFYVFVVAVHVRTQS